jgi:glycine/D-amino acid oxidase-like deaminating enzyme
LRAGAVRGDHRHPARGAHPGGRAHLSPAGVSFWHTDTGVPAPRASLRGEVEVDVAVVGAGFTGLWTAYYLQRADPSLRIAVLERAYAGFGASGRNGGWLSALVPGPRARYAAHGGRDGVLALEAAMRASIDEVAAVCATEDIDAGLHKGGTVTVATSPAQLARLQASVAAEHDWGNTDLRLMPAQEAGVRVAGALGAAFTPHCARIQPYSLVRGLARAILGRGADLYELTAVTAIAPGLVTAEGGQVRARHVVRATEGFTADLPGQHRTWLPMNSSMIVTEPLPAAVWAEIGWEHRATLTDAAHAYVYAQRTTDDRIAIGGRGVPYRYGSRTDVGGATPPQTVAALTTALTRMFPVLAGSRPAAAWSGVLGVARDWCASVGFDPASGLAWAGGYAGDGVTTSNLAGRTLADLLTGRPSALTTLPWVGRAPRRWEPEPLRYLGVTGAYAAYRAADRRESGTNSTATAPLARFADVLTGQH